MVERDGTFSLRLDARTFQVKSSGFTPERLFTLARTRGVLVTTNLSGPKPVPFEGPIVRLPFAALSEPIILKLETR